MTNRLLFAVAALPLVALSACHKPQPHVINPEGPEDPQAAQLANAAPVELPPAIKASVTFRCKDNSLVFVDFFNNDKLANLRTTKGGDNINLTAPEAGQPLTGSGYTLQGDPQKIDLTRPGKGSTTCTA